MTGTTSTCCPGPTARCACRRAAREAPFRNKRRSEMPATLKLTHKAIGAEVRRGTYDVVVDGERAGSVEMNHTIEIPVEPGRHTLQVRNGRNSSSTQTFDAAEEEIVAFRCTGKRLLPIFLASFAHPAGPAGGSHPPGRQGRGAPARQRAAAQIRCPHPVRPRIPRRGPPAPPARQSLASACRMACTRTLCVLAIVRVDRVWGQLAQCAPDVLGGQVPQRDVPDQHRRRAEQVYMCRIVRRLWLLVWLCFGAFKIASGL